MGKVHYCVVPGLVRSQSDGDIHYVGADALIRLYRLDPRRTKVIARDGVPPRPLDGEVFLYPREDGDYTLPPNSGGEEGE